MWRERVRTVMASFDSHRALDQAREQNRLEHYFTFPNFEASAERCGRELEKAGLVEVQVESFPADGRTDWYGWGKIIAWDVESARLRMTEPFDRILADWRTKPQHLVMYSGPVSCEADLVEWNGELDVDLTGRIPFTRRRINDVFAQMNVLNAPGIISDFIGKLPGVRDRFDLPDDVRWENSALRPGVGSFWGFMISPRTGELLRRLLKQGRVRVKAEIRSRVYDGVFKSVTGIIPGCETGNRQEILLVTHLYEPGANDNASGTGLGLELARSLAQCVESGAIPRPKRSIRFLFNWEGYGLYAWMSKHEDKVPDILGGINIDEIGVDQSTGRSVLHLFMPPAANSSCIGPLTEYLCRELLDASVRWKTVADRAEIINDTITSDPGLNIVLPCLIQYPSRFYHSSADVASTLSGGMVASVGTVCAAQLLFLAGAGEQELRILKSLTAGALRRSLGETETRLLEGTWPFDRRRTEEWFTEQAELTAGSLIPFGCSRRESQQLAEELAAAIRSWSATLRADFPTEAERTDDKKTLEKADALIPARTTRGSPQAWSSIIATGDDEIEFRRVLYENNLDLLFHRIVYWANGKRTLLEIVEKLEIEIDQLLRDRSISRTSSDSSIDIADKPTLKVSAVLFVVEWIIRSGYLKSISLR